MAKSAKALINPKMLHWARERSGLTVGLAAQKLRQKKETIGAWESGDKTPTFKQLIKISRTYKRPVPLFYLKKPPKDFKALHDYRRLPGVAPLNESPQLNYEIRRAFCRRQVALEIYEDLGEKPVKLAKKVTMEDDPEKLGAKIRRAHCPIIWERS